MKSIEQISNLFNKQLSKGAFINVRAAGTDNTMTIGWGSIGIFWGKPILTVVVRYSRYTQELLEKCDEFTVSVPHEGSMREELLLCGTESGRDMDKFEKAKLRKKQARKVDAPIIDGVALTIECKVLLRQAMEPALFEKNMHKMHYANRDYHVFYYGEIVDCYE